MGICIAPAEPYWAALDHERRVCNLGNTADSQPLWALTYCMHGYMQKYKSGVGVSRLPNLTLQCAKRRVCYVGIYISASLAALGAERNLYGICIAPRPG
jgi:hypothetical protein